MSELDVACLDVLAMFNFIVSFLLAFLFYYFIIIISFCSLGTCQFSYFLIISILFCFPPRFSSFFLFLVVKKRCLSIFNRRRDIAIFIGKKKRSVILFPIIFLALRDSYPKSWNANNCLTEKE